MISMDLVDRLAAHRTLATAPREELAWLAAHGSLRRLAPDEVLTRKGEPVTGLFIVLTGRLAIFLDRGTGRHKLAEWRAGDVTGMLPYSRLVSPPADSIAQEPSEILAVPRRPGGDDSRVPRGHLDARARDGRSEPSVHIGRTAGRKDGVARQAVGRPRARVEQSGGRDRTQRGAARGPARRGRRGRPPAGPVDAERQQLAAIETLRVSCRSSRVPGVLSPIQEAEREDAIDDWLAAHGVTTDIAGVAGRNDSDARGAGPDCAAPSPATRWPPYSGGWPQAARPGSSRPRFKRRQRESPRSFRRSRDSPIWTRRRSRSPSISHRDSATP